MHVYDICKGRPHNYPFIKIPFPYKSSITNIGQGFVDIWIFDTKSIWAINLTKFRSVFAERGQSSSQITFRMKIELFACYFYFEAELYDFCDFLQLSCDFSFGINK